ncbi:aspartate aminotransferase family protein [Novosphingobium sp. PC22D]|uniref:aspartate aminotransferase family protein n=1 Tax=Novosphingobium sp. PC22D TaxID=1962403 RepID=UPI000BF02680|nr:aspartate aminotransferase family protein [Novosphingobium sp. PC22D]PEQ12872.1 aspartate aminotransferase family protein [Novosphingobium sp. PC22D]
MKTNQNLENYWMPFTANRQFKARPRMIVGGEGVYYRTADGRKILDGTSGLWCCNAGHARPLIIEAIQKQAAALDYAPTFQMGNPLQFELSERLVSLAPDGISHVFYCNSGSEAVDSALKLALAYHRVRGDGSRTRLIGRERAYHGVNFGGLSVGGIVGNRKLYGHLLAGVDHLRHTYDGERMAFSRGMPEYGADLAEDLERLVMLHDASTIAAVIVEPIACSTGVLVPPEGYLARLREICDRHGILLIFDEVITAFGRVGNAFASQRFGVTPDMITIAKGLTNGAVPMGGVLCREGLFSTLAGDVPEGGIEFPHGYTYSGHPLACAAALATLDTYAQDALFDRSRELEGYFEERLHALRGLPHVKDLRNFGLIGAIELESRPDAPGARGFELYRECFEAGALIRSSGDTIALSPPLIIENGQIDILFDTIARQLSMLG